jgi:hypothetical protein
MDSREKTRISSSSLCECDESENPEMQSRASCGFFRHRKATKPYADFCQIIPTSTRALTCVGINRPYCRKRSSRGPHCVPNGTIERLSEPDYRDPGHSEVAYLLYHKLPRDYGVVSICQTCTISPTWLISSGRRQCSPLPSPRGLVCS